MRRRIVAGNWKMNLSFSEADDLLYKIVEAMPGIDLQNKEVIVCPPYVYLEMATDVSAENPIRVAAQNVSQFASGAYTGEISAAMLEAMDVDYVIIGHSERRQYFGETDEVLAQKVKMALEHDILPIFCCGEVLAEREAGQHREVVRRQLEKGVFHLEEEDFYQVIIAYEPVWAIGTGLTATPEQAQEMHALIRQWVAERYAPDLAQEMTILYGGSCNARNAAELFAQPDVDGGLIGGASLKADEFIQIMKSL